MAALAGAFLLWLMVALPRWRETSRMAGCQKNLMQIGFAVQLYHQSSRLFPTVAPLGPVVGDSPFKAMLDALALPDFLDLRAATAPAKATGAPVVQTRLPGFFCPSDPNVRTSTFASFISYRANTGDTTTGLNGPFEPGRTMTSKQVEGLDGLSFTAGFSERLVGDGQDGQPSMANYASSPSAVGPNGCPEALNEQWRGDAGSNWAESSWRSTLYNHVLLPNAPRSCLAHDGKSATMGASSSHENRVNVLMLDGSLRGVTLTISPEVWKAMSTTGVADPAAPK